MTRLQTAWSTLLLGLMLALSITPASAQTFPKLTARVVDDAHMLQPQQQAALEAKLKQIQQTTGHQVFVATIANLQGYTLEDYGNKLLRAWAPGSKDKNDGAVIFVAPNEPAGHRGPRIEVGYGLEPLLTDAFTSDVTLNAMSPRFRAGDPAGALNAGVDAVAAQIQLTPEEAAKRAAQAPPPQTRHVRHGGGGSLFFWLILFFFVGLPLLRSMGGRRYNGGGGGGGLGNILLWSALSSLGNQRSSGSWGGGDSGGGWGGGGSDFGGGGGGSGGGGGASGDW